MSDSESYRSASPTRDIAAIATNTDEVLNDHRHQAPSLPIKAGGSTASAPMVALSLDDNNRRESFKKGADESGIIRNTRSRVSEGGKDPSLHVNSPKSNQDYLNTLRREYYLLHHDADDDDDDVDMSALSYSKDDGSFAGPKRHRASSSHSFSDQIRSLVTPKDADESERRQTSSGILKNTISAGRKARTGRSNSNCETLENDLALPMTQVKTNETFGSDNQGHNRRERRASRSSIDSDADSHASRSSQETEEDVCFPMLREHIRIKGIDFDEIEEFIKEEKEEERFMKEQQHLIAERTAMRVSTQQGRSAGANSMVGGTSSAALKYTPKNLLKRTNTVLHRFKSRNPHYKETLEYMKGDSLKEKLNSDSSTVDEDSEKLDSKQFPTDSESSENVKFGSTRINDSCSLLPERFSFFSSESEETIHAPDIPSLVQPGQTVRELFRNGESTWWLDCSCPTDAEMKMLAKAFGIHPLTAEDIRMQETREKVELFRNYYFVCFHTFEPDSESEDYLESINVYIVVFREGILTFHFAPISHPANVRRRVRQLRDYVDVSADWLCYALIDDITDGFAPVITGIEYEADAIEDSVFVARELDFRKMLQRIGESRRKVMTLMRLLSGKADVIKMFAKRCQDEAAIYQSNSSLINPGPGYSGGASTPIGGGIHNNNNSYFNQSFANRANPLHMNSSAPHIQQQSGITQPRADIALYLGDIQDHVVTMFQNLVAYEKIFSRSHSNYLAQLQVESFNSNNKVTEMLSKVTLIGTLLVPLNLITGLFGMNVHVPGEGAGGLGWFFGVIGVMVFIIICFFIFARYWLNEVNRGGSPSGPVSSRRSIKSFGLRPKIREAAKSIISSPNKYE
ncbi:uncharacterized protein PRCAT00001835001 [Priceomyces carsonii]|uniref:uncharacterized protein n=1 Tax=Priceomyces carsonii TaxID=28549 RepID=UPI002ED92ABD|nr:unnamed protein product [Priceomyces carsonii]